jgi:hypothetical protein
LVVDYSEHYLYKNLREKLVESLSINNCTISGVGVWNENPDLTSTVMAPAAHITKLWGNPSRLLTDLVPNVYFRTSKHLCESEQFKGVARGHFKLSKGCLKMTRTVGDKTYKVINRVGLTLHPEHSRCDTHATAAACSAGQSAPAKVRKDDRKLNNYPFVIRTNRAIIARSGMLSLPCGPFGLFASCEAVKWGVPYAASYVKDVEKCRQDYEKKTGLCPYPMYDQVFVMTQYDDTQIGQYILEALPKLIFHLEFVKTNPNFKIHFGFTKQPTLPPFVVPHVYFNWLGLTDRLINGTVYANEIIMPREGGCQDTSYAAWEVVTQRNTFLKMIGIDEIDLVHEKPRNITKGERSILVIKRSHSIFTQNKGDLKDRRWPPNELENLLQTLAVKFPYHRIELFSDSNTTLMTNPSLQIKMFFDADIVIGFHGAGMTNTMYMKRGGIVVEVMRKFDSRHAPAIGIFPRLSALISLHHYTYYVKDIGIHGDIIANDTYDFAASIHHPSALPFKWNL